MYSVFEQLCRQKGIDTARVSRDTGIAQTTFSNWKKRNNLISGQIAIILAKYFNVSLDYLMTGKEYDDKNAHSYKISDFEYKIIVEYRKLLPLQQDVILNSLQIQRPVERKTQNEA